MMATWSIKPSCKKSIIERCHYHKDGNEIIIETGWRSGEFQCETEDDNPPEIKENDDLYDCEYHVEVIETFDGCWEEYDMENCTEETREWLEEFLDENSFFELEEHGWLPGDTEMIIACEPVIEKVEENSKSE